LNYEILASGSSGNCTILEKEIAIDMGVTFKKIKPYVKNLKLVLLTHCHIDHFNESCIKKLAEERPTLRWACGSWLVNSLVKCGVNLKNIDVLLCDLEHKYSICSITPFKLYHDVKNFGYKIFLNDKKVLYATDTRKIDHVEAKNYDLYLIESNYKEEIIKKKMKEKEARGEFCYEKRVLETHLSDEQCNEWLWRNMGMNSHFVKLHRSKNNW